MDHRLTPPPSMPSTANLALLAELSQDLAGTPDLDSTLSNAVHQTLAYMDAEAASLFLLDEPSGKLVCRACAGPVHITGLCIERQQGIVGRALSEGRVQLVRDTASDPDFSASVDRQTGFRTRSILCAPLIVKGKLLGALEAINKRQTRPELDAAGGLFADADRDFLQALAGMVALAVHNAHMTAALVEQERMKRELDLAREIQRDLLPQAAAATSPIHGINLPANEVSGDFYDYFALPDGRYVWGLGDVAGKGMNAALLMAKTISLLRCLGKTALPPGQLLARLNDELCETTRRGVFVTLAAGLYDPATGDIVLASAGHPPPLRRAPDGQWTSFAAEAPPLGIVPGIDFPETRLNLDGGRLYVYSDGVSEGRALSGDMLGIDGLRQLLDGCAESAPEAQLATITAALAGQGMRLHDDLTVLILGR